MVVNWLPPLFPILDSSKFELIMVYRYELTGSVGVVNSMAQFGTKIYWLFIQSVDKIFSYDIVTQKFATFKEYVVSIGALHIVAASSRFLVVGYDYIGVFKYAYYDYAPRSTLEKLYGFQTDSNTFLPITNTDYEVQAGIASGFIIGKFGNKWVYI